MMETLRWHSLVAASILFLFGSPLKAQNPLEQLEAKLLEREKSQTDGSKAANPAPETLPGPKNRSVKSLLVDPASSVPQPNATRENTTTPPSPTNADRPADTEPPYLGMTLERPVGGGLGLRVVEVVNQSPAWKSGFRIDDRVLAISGNAVSDIDSFASVIAQSVPNELVKFLVDRRGRQMEINVVLIPRSIAVKTIPNVPSVAIPNAPTAGSSPFDPARSNPSLPRVAQSQDGSESWGLMLAPLSDPFRRQFGIPVFRGASVLEVAPKSPGYLAGLAPGDCIVDIDGVSIRSDEDVVQWKRTAPVKPTYPISFYRGGQLMQSTVQGPSLSEFTPDMLTPEYVQQLQTEIAKLRLELNRSKELIRSLENSTSSPR